jgi:hypothetical protein
VRNIESRCNQLKLGHPLDAGLQGIERSRASLPPGVKRPRVRRAGDDLSSAALLIGGAHTLVAELVKKRGKHMCVSLKWKWTESLL